MFQDEYLIQLWLEHDSHEIYPMNFIPCNNLFAMDAFGCQNTIDTNVLLNYYLTKFCEDNHRCSQFPCADWWRGQPPGFTLFWVNDKSTQSNHSLPRAPQGSKPLALGTPVGVIVGPEGPEKVDYDDDDDDDADDAIPKIFSA